MATRTQQIIKAYRRRNPHHGVTVTGGVVTVFSGRRDNQQREEITLNELRHRIGKNCAHDALPIDANTYVAPKPPRKKRNGVTAHGRATRAK